jgi:6-phosphogluconolactonase
MDFSLHCFRESNAADVALASFVSHRLRTALAARQVASLVISGGRTPQGFFRQLSQERLDWSRVVVTLADERWVGEDSPHSNARTVRQGLLANAAAAARFIPLYHPAASAAESAALASDALRILPPVIDVVVLGMGDDGHTASLFQDSPHYHAALYDATPHACLAVSGKAPVRDRLTLSAPRLARCESLVAHFTGNAKWRTFSQVIGSEPEAFPLGFLFNTTTCTSKHVFWNP